MGLAEVAVRLLIPVKIVGPTTTVYDPAYGKWLKSSFSCRLITPEFTYRLTTNSLGLRGPEPTSPLQGTVLFIGDSLTMGYAVNDGEEYPDRLRRRLADRFGEGRVPALNIGLAGNGNGRWIKFLRSDAQQFEPSFVILQMHQNDFEDNRRERLFDLTQSGQLRELRVPPRSMLRKVQPIIESIPGLSYSYLYSLIRGTVVASVRREPAVSPPVSGAAHMVPAKEADMETRATPRELLTYRLVEEALIICQERGWPVIAITLAIEGARRERLHELFDRYDAPLIRVPSKGERPDLYWAHDIHWNADGHAWVADAVLRQLLSDPRFDAAAGRSVGR